MTKQRMLSQPELEQAARLRYASGRMPSWEEIAQKVGCHVRTLYDYRHRAENEDWQAAINTVVAEMRQEGLPAAWQCLVRQARKGDTQAAKELLNRIEGVTKQEIEHSGDIDLSAVWLEGIGEDGSDSPDA